jgi:DNA-binding NtrC family response regulator
MPGKRIHANELLRLFNAVETPIYALDEARTIIFLNSACQAWLNLSPEELIGRQASYHSSSEPATPEGIAAAICPPPEAFAGVSASGILRVSPLPLGEGPGVRAEPTLPHQPTTELRRRANFLPIGTPEKPRGVLAILVAQDGAAEEPIPSAASLAELDREQLHDAIRRFRREIAGRCSADRLIGTSPAMQLARRQVQAAAISDCSVCIVGPQGSGRERLAAAIHYASNPDDAKLSFAQGGLISLDGSVLPTELLLSTLHALSNEPKGTSRPSSPAQSSLVLHRVDELADEVQAQLAALLAKKPFPRRLISTVATPIAELAQRGKFRADLASQLATIVIHLPPLAERIEDLPLLAQIFLEDCNRRGAKQVAAFTPEALDRLDAYPWPGNLDELAATVATAHQNAAGTEIKPEELPEQIRLAAQAAAHPRKAEDPIRLDEFLERVERELIRRAIARVKGNKTKAARLLGLTRPRLYRRMIQLGLEEA